MGLDSIVARAYPFYMTKRINQEMLDLRIIIVNRQLGQSADPTVDGAVRIGMAYGGYRVEEVIGHSGGVATLSDFGYGTKRECFTFLQGMSSALKILKEREQK